MVAKTPEALAFFSGAFKDRLVSKAYLAIAVGLPQPDEPRAGPSYTSSATAAAAAAAEAADGAGVKKEAAPGAVTAAGKYAEVFENVDDLKKKKRRTKKSIGCDFEFVTSYFTNRL